MADPSAAVSGASAQAQAEAAAAAAKAAKAKILEGVDFIETEEDAEAVESAVVKIQSTFRGKKIRSKLNKQTPNNNEAPSAAAAAVATKAEQPDGQSADDKQVEKQQQQQPKEKGSSSRRKDEEEELKRGVATMQVNDNNSNSNNNNNKPANELLANLPEDEVARAATKIQAGFKGYKTRKELEGKLAGGGSVSSSAGHQVASHQREAADK